MQRTSCDVEDRLDVTELIERIAVERGESPLTDTGRHRLHVATDVRRSRRRRLAPLAAGALAVLVATTVAVALRPADDAPAGPELDAALVGASSASVAATPSPAPTVPAPAVALPAPTSTTASASPSATAAPTSAPRATARPTKKPAATPAPAAAAAPVAKKAPAARPAADDGTSAAAQQGWTLVDRDEFNGALSPKWSKYDSKGHAGNGRRSPDAISVRDGAVVIHGDAKGTTGGMSWDDNRSTGRWEMRAKFPKGDRAYHPVLLLWPEEGGTDDGEVDFAETTSASDKVSFFLHYGSGEQKSAEKALDLTQWHNYAVEVTKDRVTGYIDGQKWFESTDPDTLPRGPVHPVIQLDWFPKGNSPTPTEILVDWMRIYE